MKVYLSDTLSILEYLYIKSRSEGPVSLVNSISEADFVVNCAPTDLFYDKTIIINNDGYDKDTIQELSKFNEIVSRFPLECDATMDYDLSPYENETSLRDFEFDGRTRNVLSKLSIKQFIIMKVQNSYKMKLPQIFVNTKVRGYNTMIGLLQGITTDKITPKPES